MWIDVSHHQGEMKWPLAIRAGVRGAVIRAGSCLEDTGKIYQDTQLVNNKKVQDRLPVSSYWYFRPQHDPRAQADAFCEFTHDLRYLKLWADVETSGGMGPVAVANAVADFVMRIKLNTGRWPGIYTRALWWNASVAPDPLWMELDLWIAIYNNYYHPWLLQDVKLVPRDWANRDYLMWQFTDKGPGALYGAASVSIDCNHYNGPDPVYSGLADQLDQLEERVVALEKRGPALPVIGPPKDVIRLPRTDKVME